MSKILVIEDEADIRELIEQTLEFEGYDVTIAENGRIGIEHAKEILPDLIVCDINMPELDGYGVLAELHANKNTSSIPFIFLTARVDKKDVREGMNLGADDYLIKPFSIEDLKQSIETRLKKSSKMQEKENEKVDELKKKIGLSLPHELRTPLVGILGFAELFAFSFDSLSREEFNEMAKMLLDSAKRLNKTIEKYLLYAHLVFLNNNESKLTQLRKTTFRISESKVKKCVSGIVDALGRNDDLSISIKEAELNIDEEFLSIIIEQIGSNCFDYSEKGTLVNITGETTKTEYILTFIDNGRGMKKSQIEQISAFNQFDRDIYEQQGTGIGLALAQNIVSVFGGKIIIDSEPGSGTTVRTVFKCLGC